MTTPEDNLHQQLDQATTWQQAAGEPLDAETDHLRRAWLNLGELLEAAQPEEPVTLRTACLEPDAKTSRFRRWGVVATALAATLLVAIAGTWISRTWRHLPTTTRTAGQAQAVTTATREAAHTDTDRELASIAWDDAIDQQLLAAWQRVDDLRSHQAMVDAIHGAALGSAYQIEQELGDDETL